MRGQRTALLVATIGLFMSPATPAGAESDPTAVSTSTDDDRVPLQLLASPWMVQYLGRGFRGTIMWIGGDDGALRVELAREGPVASGDPAWATAPDLDSGLTRMGEGWTVALGSGDEGTINAWHREWRACDPTLARLVRTVLGALDGGSARTASGRMTLAPSAEEQDSPRSGSSWRRRCAHRGRGGGGPGEVVSWSMPDGEAGALVLRSTRRPGSAHVGAPTRTPVLALVPEVFVPLWPLGELLDILLPDRELRLPGTVP